MALFRTVNAEFIGLAIVQTLFAHESRGTLTLASDMITISAVIAITLSRASFAVHAGLAAIRANATHPTRLTRALARFLIANAIVLASTFIDTIASDRTLATLTTANEIEIC